MKIEINNAEACTSDISFAKTKSNLVSLQKTSVENSISAQPFLLSPNPASSVLRLERPAPNSEVIRVMMLNGIGQKVGFWEMGSSKELEMDISNLSNGPYHIQVLDRKGQLMTSKSFIKQ